MSAKVSSPNAPSEYVVGGSKVIKLGAGHFNPGDRLPATLMLEGEKERTKLEDLHDFEDRLDDGTFVKKPLAAEQKEEELRARADLGITDAKNQPMQLPSQKQWVDAGYGKHDGKLLEGKALDEAYEKFVDGLRAEAKKTHRKVIEPAK